MQLAVGLGNPGDRYISTRHNVGFRVVTAWATACGIDSLDSRFSGLYGCSPPAKRRAWKWWPGRWMGVLGGRTATSDPDRDPDADRDPDRELGALLPQTFMNRSGESVAAALEGLPALDLRRDFVVVIDDLDLPFGRIRIRPSGGAGGHRGLASLIDHLETRDFPRLRFGIGRPGPDEDPVKYVLAPFTPSEEELLREGIDRGVKALETLFRAGVPAAMDQFNGLPALGEH